MCVCIHANLYWNWLLLLHCMCKAIYYCYIVPSLVIKHGYEVPIPTAISACAFNFLLYSILRVSQISSLFVKKAQGRIRTHTICFWWYLLCCAHRHHLLRFALLPIITYYYLLCAITTYYYLLCAIAKGSGQTSTLAHNFLAQQTPRSVWSYSGQTKIEFLKQ